MENLVKMTFSAGEDNETTTLFFTPADSLDSEEVAVSEGFDNATTEETQVAVAAETGPASACPSTEDNYEADFVTNLQTLGSPTMIATTVVGTVLLLLTIAICFLCLAWFLQRGAYSADLPV